MGRLDHFYDDINGEGREMTDREGMRRRVRGREKDKERDRQTDR